MPAAAAAAAVAAAMATMSVPVAAMAVAVVVLVGPVRAMATKACAVGLAVPWMNAATVIAAVEVVVVAVLRSLAAFTIAVVL